MNKRNAFLAAWAFVLAIALGVFAALPNTADGAIKVNTNINQMVEGRLQNVFARICLRFPHVEFGFCSGTNTNTNTNSNTNQNTNTNTNTNQNTNVNTNTNTNTNTNGNINQNTNTNGNTNSGGGNPPQTGAVLLSEVFTSGTNALEWLEVYNGMNVSVDLSGWMISDNAGTDFVPTTTPIIPGGFLILTATSTPGYLEPLPAGTTKVFLSATIGSGLGASGDEVRLKSASGIEMDAMNYGNVTTVFSPSVPLIAAGSGNSYYRTSLATDTNTAADWNAHAPNPGT